MKLGFAHAVTQYGDAWRSESFAVAFKLFGTTNHPVAIAILQSSDSLKSDAVDFQIMRDWMPNGICRRLNISRG